MAIDYNSIVQSLVPDYQAANAASEQLAANMGQRATQMEADAATSAAEGKNYIVNTALAAAKAAQAEHIQSKMMESFQTQLGMNPDDINNEISKSFVELQNSRQEYKQVRNQYDAIAGTSILDDPIGFIIGQIQLPAIAAQVNAASDKQAAALGNIEARNNTLQGVRSNVVANTADLVHESKLAKAVADEAAAKRAVLQTSMENSSRIAGITMQQQALSDKKLDNVREIVKLQMQASQTADASASLTIQREQLNMIRQEKLDAIRNAKDADAQINAGLGQMSTFLGMQTPWTTTTIKRIAPKQASIIQMAAVNGSFGATLAEALPMYNAIDGKGNIQATNPGAYGFITATQRAFAETVETVRTEYQKRGQKVPQQQILEQEALERIQAKNVAAMGTRNAGETLSSPSFDPGRQFNPYRADNNALILGTASGQLKALQDNELQKSLATIASTKKGGLLTSEDEQRAIGMLANKVEMGEMTPAKAAAEMASYYRTAMQRNLDTYQYTVFGYAPQTSYMGKIAPASTFGKAVTVDWSNPNELEKYFTQRTAEEKARAVQYPDAYRMF